MSQDVTKFSPLSEMGMVWGVGNLPYESIHFKKKKNNKLRFNMKIQSYSPNGIC